MVPGSLAQRLEDSVAWDVWEIWVEWSRPVLHLGGIGSSEHDGGRRALMFGTFIAQWSLQLMPQRASSSAIGIPTTIPPSRSTFSTFLQLPCSFSCHPILTTTWLRALHQSMVLLHRCRHRHQAICRCCLHPIAGEVPVIEL